MTGSCHLRLIDGLNCIFSLCTIKSLHEQVTWSQKLDWCGVRTWKRFIVQPSQFIYLFIFQHWKSNPLIDWNKSQRTAKEYLTIKRQTCSARYIISLHRSALHYITYDTVTCEISCKCYSTMLNIFFFIHFFPQLSYQFFHYFLANFILFSILNVLTVRFVCAMEIPLFDHVIS